MPEMTRRQQEAIVRAQTGAPAGFRMTGPVPHWDDTAGTVDGKPVTWRDLRKAYFPDIVTLTGRVDPALCPDA